MSRTFAKSGDYLKMKMRHLYLLAVAGLAFTPTLPVHADAMARPSAAEAAAPAATKPTNAVPLTPGANDGRIAFVVARLLEQSHYLRHPLDDAFSEKFFDRYLETLDPQHLHFLQSDLAEFDHYRTNLDRLTLTRKGVADTTPAYEIFARFLERLEQRAAYTDELLKHKKFEFNTDERITVNRHDLPYPKDLAEAQDLWRQRLCYDYLQEELGRLGSKKKADAPDAKTDLRERVENGPPPKSAEPGNEVKKKTDAEEIVDTLTRRYNRTVHMFREWDNDDVLQVYLTALAHVYDPHSDYFNKSAADNFAITMNLQLFGIGAVLTTDMDGYCKIAELKPGPAMKSKLLKPNDRIVAVAQGDQPPVDVVEMNLNKVVQLIRGPKGTEVRLTIIPADDASQRRLVTLIRDEIKLEDQQAKSKIIELPNGGKTLRLGVLDLPSFYTPIDLSSAAHPSGESKSSARRFAAADVAQLLKKLESENVGGVILDLRGNGGGSLEEAVKLTGLFIKTGPVVQVRATDGGVFEDEDTDASVKYDGPLIVLTSRYSASASEILAGALQDYGRALIVGDISTHGKGTVQNLTPLRQVRVLADLPATNDPGTLKITIRKFYRASGASTQLKGVLPDIVLPSVRNYSTDIGESALENPLPWDTIPSARFDHLNRVEPYVAELLKRSADRVATNQDFVYIREDIEQFRKSQADKTVSLNEQARLKEKEEADARQKARDTERRTRRLADQKIYELTLQQSELPGLPPPVEKTNSAVAKTADIKVAGSLAASTNSASVATKATKPALGTDDTPDEGEVPAVDPTLEEAERILTDYIALMSQKSMITANH